MILRVADTLVRAFTDLLEPHGITVQQYNVLRILRGAKGPLPTMTIGERMIEETPGITRLLDRLESKGYVYRSRDLVDRRQVLCSITAPGLALLGLLDAPIQDFNDLAMAPLAQRDVVRLTVLLSRVKDGISPKT